MKEDSSMTKEELIGELAEMRRRFAEQQAIDERRKQMDEAMQRAFDDLENLARILMREDEFKRLLGIPCERRLLALIPVGVPAERPIKEKKPLEQVLHWEKF